MTDGGPRDPLRPDHPGRPDAEFDTDEEQTLQPGSNDPGMLAQDSTQGTGAGAIGTAVAGGDVPMRQASLWGDAWRQLRRNPLFIIPALIVILFTLMAIFPQLFTFQEPHPRFCDLANSRDKPSMDHWFGFDSQGCDYYTRVVYGTRISLIIGLLVVFVDSAIAVVLGCLAGFYGRWVDALVARFADIWFAVPTTLGAIVFLSVLGERGLLQVSLVLIVLGWPTTMRLMRSSVLSVKEMDYVQAARALGASDFRILLRHILPNGLAPVIVYGTITVGIIIAAEAALSFLGVGLQLPAISWGLMISSAQNVIEKFPHLLLFPGLFLSLLVFSFILLGDALRDALDPKLR